MEVSQGFRLGLKERPVSLLTASLRHIYICSWGQQLATSPFLPVPPTLIPPTIASSSCACIGHQKFLLCRRRTQQPFSFSLCLSPFFLFHSAAAILRRGEFNVVYIPSHHHHDEYAGTHARTHASPENVCVNNKSPFAEKKTRGSRQRESEKRK